MILTTCALTAETWDAYARMVDDHNGIFGGCWCLSFHQGTSGGSYDERRALKQAMVTAGRSHAALVMDGTACVGAVQFGRTADLQRIKNRKAYEAGLTILPDWRITCFFTARTHRRQGVAALGLSAALDQIAAQGGGLVEAYPDVLEGQKTAASFLWSGTLTLFEQAGFTAGRRIGLHKVVAARQIAAA